MVVRKRVAGVVEHNDGEFSVVQTVGIEEPEKGLLLEEVQFHREDTEDTPEEFERRFPVGMWLDITTTTEITLRPVTCHAHLGNLDTGTILACLSQ